MNEKTYFSKVWSVEPLPEGDWSKEKKKAFFSAKSHSAQGTGVVVTPLAALIFHCSFLVLSPPPPVNRYK